MLRKYIARAIAPDPENVLIEYCPWGEEGAKPHWAGACAPDSPLRNLIKERLAARKVRHQRLAAKLNDGRKKVMERVLQKREALKSRLKVDRKKLSVASRRVLNNANKLPELLQKNLTLPKLTQSRLKHLQQEELSDVCVAVISNDSTHDANEQTLLIMAADDVAYAPDTLKQLADCDQIEDEVKTLQSLIRTRYEELRKQLGLRDAANKIDLRGAFHEVLLRTAHGPGYALTRAVVSMRAAMNGFVMMFMGDVLTYLTGRGTARSPGAIPACFIERLRKCQQNKIARNNEPIVVFSHSMGGQIVYDVVTHFLPKSHECADLKIDFWCAAASQIGFFEELKLFLEDNSKYGLATGKRVPYPDPRHLGYWWNVWDHNDFLSYSVKNIIEGVDDEPYNAGLSAVEAHGGYLVMPSFFRKFARKIQHAQTLGWSNASAARSDT